MARQNTGTATAVRPRSKPLLSRLDITSRTVAILIASAILVGNILYAPGRFADYYAYLLLTDRIYFFPNGDLLGFEAASNLIFLGLRILTHSTVTAVNLAHYGLGIVCTWGFWRLAGREEVDWRGLVFVFAIYGAALGFVTIRATPACLLVAIATLEASKGRRSAIILALIATLFHVSAILALVPIVAVLAQNQLRVLAWIGNSHRAVFLVGASLVVAFLLLNALATASLMSLIESVPFLGKYVAYTSSLDPMSQASGAVPTRSTAHTIYFVFASALTLVMLLAPADSCRRMRSYVLVSYTIFIFLQFSPVTAYRQSQFWVIPAALVLPWRWFAPTGIRSVLMLIGGAVLFCLGYAGVVS